MNKKEQVKELKQKIVNLTDEQLDAAAGGMPFSCLDERCVYKDNHCVCPDDDE